jgi:hypothetical protein
MASMQQKSREREERARSAAQKAADELAASRREEVQQVHEEATTPISPRGGGILSSVQEKAAAAIERAKEYAVEKKEGARQALAGDAVGRKGETDESAWQQGQDVRRRAAEKAQEEARRRVREPSEEEKYVHASTHPFLLPHLQFCMLVSRVALFWIFGLRACRGRAATENIYGKGKGATGAFGEKMVMPTDVVERKRAEAAAGGGDGEAAAASPPAPGIGDDDVMLRVKEADQMTGQAFNDVGPMGEEGTGMPRRRR